MTNSGKHATSRPHLKNVRPAMLSVGGWFDAEDLLGPLAVYRALEAQSPQTTSTLVMGPWSHGGWMGDGEQLGNVKFASKTGEYFRDKIMLPFFVHYLKKPPGRLEDAQSLHFRNRAKPMAQA